jgi:hypothetical protein
LCVLLRGGGCNRRVNARICGSSSLYLADHVPLQEELLDTFLQGQDHSYRLLDSFIPFLEFLDQRLVQVVSLPHLALQCVQSLFEAGLPLSPVVEFELQVKVLLVQRG